MEVVAWVGQRQMSGGSQERGISPMGRVRYVYSDERCWSQLQILALVVKYVSLVSYKHEIFSDTRKSTERIFSGALK